MRKPLISMTFHRNIERLKSLKWSHRFYDEYYVEGTRLPLLRKQYNDFEHLTYIARQWADSFPNIKESNAIYGTPHGFVKHHDSHAGMLVAAQYAYANNMNWLYIENDCMVYNLKGILDWASDKKIVYGFGEYSYAPTFAEQSLMYVSNDFIPEFLYRFNNERLHELNKQWPESIWHNIYKDVADYWPFGYGRTRPIDFDKEIFYAQQLQDWELDKFIELINAEY